MGEGVGRKEDDGGREGGGILRGVGVRRGEFNCPFLTYSQGPQQCEGKVGFSQVRPTFGS